MVGFILTGHGHFADGIKSTCHVVTTSTAKDTVVKSEKEGLMVGFILTGHGHFADGIKSALDMVAGDQENFEIVPFEGSQAATYGDDLRAAITKMRGECEGSQAATYGDDLRAAITKMRGECEEGVIVFVDLLGGTPFNQSMMIANDVDKLEIVTGSNLPMIIELLFARNGATDVTALAEQAVTVGASSSSSTCSAAPRSTSP